MMTCLFFFAVLAITLWLVSLWRILFSSLLQVNPSFLSNSIRDVNGRRKSNVLLVVAHPDDESMFFAPTILYLTSKGHNLHILCISNGNADGKGNIRKEELYRACAILEVPLQQIKIVDHLDLQDGFGKPWDHQLLATFVEEEIKKQFIDVGTEIEIEPRQRSLPFGTLDNSAESSSDKSIARSQGELVATPTKVITFDNYGVSGHPNHRDVFFGICMFLRENVEINVEAWELISTNIIRKYIGPVDIWISMLSSLSGQRGSICLSNQNPLKCYQAMAEHYSQWVWFRKLFVVLSRYTYVNTLRRIIY